MTEAASQARFAADLRAATWTGHESAETTRFWASITGTKFDPTAYAALQSQLYFVYDALEGALDDAADAAIASSAPLDRAIAAIYAPELARGAALRMDLVDLLGADWPDRIRPLPATARYVERILDIAPTPTLLLAHHYTRYLGDLSGGLFIGRRVRTNLGRAGDEGVRFYVFDEIPDPGAFKHAYRERLDALPIDAQQQTAIIDEVGLAYGLNSAVLAELDDVTSADASDVLGALR
jgi:heme oxygenase